MMKDIVKIEVDHHFDFEPGSSSFCGYFTIEVSTNTGDSVGSVTLDSVEDIIALRDSLSDILTILRTPYEIK